MSTTVTSAPRWSALFYLAGANDLGASMQRTLHDLGESRLPENVDVFVQSYDNDGQSVRYRLEQDAEGNAVPADRVEVAQNAGDPANLESFVRYARESQPDNATFLIAGGHGEGHRGVLTDDLHNDRLDLSELEGALSAQPVDALMFDSCLMNTLEVARTLDGEVGVMVASQDVVLSGAPLADYLRAASGSADARELGTRLVEGRGYNFSTLTAVDTAASGAAVAPLKSLSGHLLEVDAETVERVYEESRRGLQGAGHVLMGYYMYPGERVDVGSFCRHLLDEPGLSDELKAAAGGLLAAVGSATIAHSAKTEDGSTGLTLGLALYRDKVEASPEEVALWSETGWDKVIDRFQTHNKKKAQAPDILSLMKKQARA